MSEKPIYSLTPISDHAKELLNAIDNPPTVVNEDRHEKHKPFGTLYGEKHREPPYTERQVKELESMYGYNADKLKNSSKYRMITNGHLLVTKKNIDQLDSNTYLANCIVSFETSDLYDKCVEKGIIFKSCVIYPNGVNFPLRLNKDGVCYGENSI